MSSVLAEAATLQSPSLDRFPEFGEWCMVVECSLTSLKVNTYE